MILMVFYYGLLLSRILLCDVLRYSADFYLSSSVLPPPFEYVVKQEKVSLISEIPSFASFFWFDPQRDVEYGEKVIPAYSKAMK